MTHDGGGIGYNCLNLWHEEYLCFNPSDDSSFIKVIAQFFRHAATHVGFNKLYYFMFEKSE